MTSTSALILNCSLKKSDQTSNTDALLEEFRTHFKEKDITTETVRVADYEVEYGIGNDMGNNDEWPKILDKIKAADILILASPVWLGEKSSISKKVLERLNGCSDTNEKGQPIFYNKIGGAVVTGNEDGAKKAAGDLIFGLAQLGFTIPPNPIAYWVGAAGPGKSYIDAEGYKNDFTMKNAKMASHNIANFAKLLKQHPIPPDGNTQ